MTGGYGRNKNKNSPECIRCNIDISTGTIIKPHSPNVVAGSDDTHRTTIAFMQTPSHFSRLGTITATAIKTHTHTHKYTRARAGGVDLLINL